MIKNGLALATLALLLAGLGCSRAEADEEPSYQGVIEFEESVIGFELSGRLESILVNEGDRLERGQKLAVLDDTMTRSARALRVREVDAAESQVELVEAGSRPEEIAAMAARVRAAQAAEELLQKNVERQRELFAKGAVARASLDELEAQLARSTAERQSLEQTLSALRRGARKVEIRAAATHAEAVAAAVAVDDVRLARHELFAPRRATVLDVHAELGEVVAAGTPIVTLADTLHPYADLFVPQGKLKGVHVGTKAQIRIDAIDRVLSGRVEHISRRTEFTPRYLFSERERPNLVVRVRVRIDDPKEQLLAGVPAFVSLAENK